MPSAAPPSVPEHKPGAPPGEIDLPTQVRMVQALRRQLAAGQAGGVACIETHISFVLVAGDRAYKIKKALRTPFLDQSTLALRRHACSEELRLNRRLAPALYLDVLPITGTPDQPDLGGAGAVIDVAVSMRAFAADGLWDRLAERGALGAPQIDELVRVIVPFHAHAAVADPGARLGAPDQVRAPLLQSLQELQDRCPGGADHPALAELRRWESAAFDRLRPVLAQRLAQGRVRECHGDLHLGNVTMIDGRSTVFDGIEFNDDFRWIDVMSEVAFMAMDLHAKGLAALANRFVNAYLESTGDYDGVAVLDYYLVHRALVRAKVHLLRATQCPAGAADLAGDERVAGTHYIDLALQFSRRNPRQAVLLITHGLSGSGKSTLTQDLLEALGAIRVRADVERKRLAGLPALDRRGATAMASLYGPAMTAATYDRLADLAAGLLRCGYAVIVDATHLQQAQRQRARQLAAHEGVACFILDFEADAATLRQRLHARAAQGGDASDADEAVLALQQRVAQPLQGEELALVHHCPPAQLAPDGSVHADWTTLLERIAAATRAAAAGAPGGVSSAAPPRR